MRQKLLHIYKWLIWQHVDKKENLKKRIWWICFKVMWICICDLYGYILLHQDTILIYAIQFKSSNKIWCIMKIKSHKNTFGKTPLILKTFCWNVCRWLLYSILSSSNNVYKTFKKIIVHYDRNAYHNFHILFIIFRCHVYHECFLESLYQSFIWWE